jgi:hypothetical protein
MDKPEKYRMVISPIISGSSTLSSSFYFTSEREQKKEG